MLHTTKEAYLQFKPEDKVKSINDVPLDNDDGFYCSLWIGDAESNVLKDICDHMLLSVGLPWNMIDEEIEQETNDDHVYGNVSLDILIEDMIDFYVDDPPKVTWLAARFRLWASQLEEAHVAWCAAESKLASDRRQASVTETKG